jgi:hypothetical protein
MHRDVYKTVISLKPTAQNSGETCTLEWTINVSPFTIEQVIFAVKLSVCVYVSKSTKLQAVLTHAFHDFGKPVLVNAKIAQWVTPTPYSLTHSQ